jgi:hypothetical protein
VTFLISINGRTELTLLNRYEDYTIVYQSRNPFEFLGNGFSVVEYNGSDLSHYLGSLGTTGGVLPKPKRLVADNEQHQVDVTTVVV